MVRSTGQPIEFEGGEFITNVSATRRNFEAIRQINADRGRTQFALVPKFAMGGVASGSAAGISEAIRQINSDRGRTQFSLVPKFATGGVVSGSAAGISAASVGQMQSGIDAQQLTASLTAALAAMPAPVLALEEFKAFDRAVEIKNNRASL